MESSKDKWGFPAVPYWQAKWIASLAMLADLDARRYPEAGRIDAIKLSSFANDEPEEHERLREEYERNRPT